MKTRTTSARGIGRIVTCVMVVAIVLSTFVPAFAAETASPFKDVNPGDWYYSCVLDMYGRGLVNGKGDGKFHPNDVITKAEYYTILCRMSGLDTTNPAGASHWATGAANSLAAYQDDKGFSSNSYEYAGLPVVTSRSNLNTALTRQDAVILAMECIGLSVEDIPNTQKPELINPFRDISTANVSNWVYNYLINAYYMGIVGGDNNGNFQPNGTLTRAAACKILLNTFALDTTNFNYDVTSYAAYFPIEDVINIKWNPGTKTGHWYITICEGLSDIPDDILATWKGRGAKMTIQNKKLYLDGRNVPGICWWDGYNIEISATDGTDAHTITHEVCHYVYRELLSANDRQTISRAFSNGEAKALAEYTNTHAIDGTYRTYNYCEYDVDEFGAEILSFYLSDPDAFEYGHGFDSSLTVVENFFNK